MGNYCSIIFEEWLLIQCCKNNALGDISRDYGSDLYHREIKFNEDKKISLFKSLDNNISACEEAYVSAANAFSLFLRTYHEFFDVNDNNFSGQLLIYDYDNPGLTKEIIDHIPLPCEWTERFKRNPSLREFIKNEVPPY